MKGHTRAGGPMVRSQLVAVRATAVGRNHLENGGFPSVDVLSPFPLMCRSGAPPQAAGEAACHLLICCLS